MSPRPWPAWLAREMRGSLGRLLFFAACLSIGVAAVVAVATTSSAIDRGVRAEARRLLAADVAVSSRRPLPRKLGDTIAATPGARRADVLELPTMASAPDVDGSESVRASALVELKVAAPGYPFYGRLELEPEIGAIGDLPADACVVGPDLLERLGVARGGRVRLGDATFRVVATVVAEPDRLNISLTLGPRVFLSPAGFARTGLEAFGSRIDYRALVALRDQDPAAARRLAERIRAAVPDVEYDDVETWEEAQPALRRGIERVERFLGLVALLSLLVGGIGVAQAIRAWIAGRMEAIAILRSLGFRPREVVGLYLAQTALLGLAGSAAGAVIGSAAARALPAIVRRWLPVSVDAAADPYAVARGLALGVGVAVLFALPPLLEVRRVSPARVFRRDAEPLPASRTVRAATAALLIAGVAATAAMQAASVARGAAFAAGLVVVASLLAAAAAFLIHVVGRVPRSGGGVALRYGIAALARPGAGTIGAVVALGVGVLVVVAMAQIQGGLSRQLGRDVPADAPTTFLVDVQAAQWDGVRSLLERAGATGIDSAPVVVARLRAVDGRDVADLVPDGPDAGRKRWVLTREQRLTYRATLPAGNRLVAGALWSDPDRPEVSVEREFARDLGVGVGSTLRFDVQGVPLELEVTSLREVRWESFGINFFLLVEPGVLDGAPQFRVVAARVPARSDDMLRNALAGAYPNVTLLDVREILGKVVAVLDRIGFGVRLLGGLTVIAGVAILAGVIGAGSIRRAREVALLKTLGMTRGGIVAVFATEYALIGLVAGVVGATSAIALAWAALRFVLEVDAVPGLLPPVVGIVGASALAIVAGTAASVRALRRRPVEILREE